jgi:Flp pilus assembly protein TadG
MINAKRIGTILRNSAGGFVRNRDGNVGLAFALALLPIFGVTGAAIDYSRASSARSQLHNALDSTVLALAKRAPLLSDAQLKAEAERYFKAVMTERDDLATLPITVQRTDKAVSIKAAGVMPTRFMHLFGRNTIDIASLSEAAISQRRVEIALVLDNTGSMSRLNKMDELKKATRNLIDAAEKAAPTGTGMIKIALVPFDTHVKLDPNANRFASWLVTKDESADPAFDDIRNRPAPRSAMISRASWAGCITDRGTGYDANGRPSVLALAPTLHPAMTCTESGSLAFTQPLTDNYPALRAAAAAMRPSGCTNITIGARFGLAALSPAGSGPLGAGVAFGTPDVDKYVVLLTDGDNTANRYVDGCNGSGDTRLIDAKTKAMCDDIKARSSRRDAKGNPIPDVKVFTIRVLEGNRSLLQNCASDPSMYKEVSDASQLDAVFKNIFSEITRLKLTM